MRLGEIFIQLKLDISQFKDALLKQKAEVERSAREIESINIASAKKSTSSQLEEYNKNKELESPFIIKADKDGINL